MAEGGKIPKRTPQGKVVTVNLNVTGGVPSTTVVGGASDHIAHQSFSAGPTKKPDGTLKNGGSSLGVPPPKYEDIFVETNRASPRYCSHRGANGGNSRKGGRFRQNWMKNLSSQFSDLKSSYASEGPSVPPPGGSGPSFSRKPVRMGEPITVALRPGLYRVGFQMRSKGQPFRITFSRRRSSAFEGPLPREQQPLFYEGPPVGASAPSFPRRLIRRLLFRVSSSPTKDPAKNSNGAAGNCALHPSSSLKDSIARNPHVRLFAVEECAADRKAWGSRAQRRTHRRNRLAEIKKCSGNCYYKKNEYREALKCYNQAIELCPECASYYSNRSACYMMLGKYTEALHDARKALELDSAFLKGFIRVAKCSIALGDATAALSVLRQAHELDSSNQAVMDEVIKATTLQKSLDEAYLYAQKKDFRTAIFHLDHALKLAVGCRSLKITKAEYLVYLQRYPEAAEIVNEILQFSSCNVDALYVRGMCLYYQDNIDKSFSHFQQVLRLAPDHSKARDIYKKAKSLKQKKEEGNAAFKTGNLNEAFKIYTEALSIDPLNKPVNSKLYFNRALVAAKLNRDEEAISDCTAAINLDEGYIKAYKRRAKSYQTLEKHEEAVRDFEKVLKSERNEENKNLLQNAKILLKQSKRKDYYKILGVMRDASDDEIKKSYKKLALVHHPDRHSNASAKEKEEHEVKFKEVGEAYAVLTDPKKRSMYDRGQDLNDLDTGFEYPGGDFDPNVIFEGFFGDRQSGFMFPSATQGGTFSSGGGFPQGFHFQFGL